LTVPVPRLTVLHPRRPAGFVRHHSCPPLAQRYGSRLRHGAPAWPWAHSGPSGKWRPFSLLALTASYRTTTEFHAQGASASSSFFKVRLRCLVGSRTMAFSIAKGRRCRAMLKERCEHEKMMIEITIITRAIKVVSFFHWMFSSTIHGSVRKYVVFNNQVMISTKNRKTLIWSI
jgi:hypothetical protein